MKLAAHGFVGNQSTGRKEKIRLGRPFEPIDPATIRCLLPAHVRRGRQSSGTSESEGGCFNVMCCDAVGGRRMRPTLAAAAQHRIAARRPDAASHRMQRISDSNHAPLTRSFHLLPCCACGACRLTACRQRRRRRVRGDSGRGPSSCTNRRRRRSTTARRWRKTNRSGATRREVDGEEGGKGEEKRTTTTNQLGHTERASIRIC